jgi:filamentous hemagglutinin
MEHPYPGAGGRHRETFTYGTTADVGMSARDALAAGVRDARRIYQNQGLYWPYIGTALQELIRQNKSTFPQVFGQ